MTDAIYLDYHATTPVDPRVMDVMLPFFTRVFGNPSSHTHAYGWEAEAAVEAARASLAESLDVDPSEIVFTSGATEADNLALRGVMEANRERGAHLLTVITEHKAVLDAATALERDGFGVTRLPVDGEGLISAEALSAALEPGTVLASVMHANNEIGVLQPIEDLAAACHERAVLFHCDAAQSIGKVPLTELAGADFISLSGHKVYGPKGIGALVVRRRVAHRIRALQHGGGHEHGLRSGTLPVPLIVGFAEAVRLAVSEQKGELERLSALRDRLHRGLSAGIPGLIVNGSMARRLPNNLNVSISHVDPDALLMAMPDLAVSTGSACTSSSDEPSYVLKALGRSDALAASALRFGLGRFTTEAEIDRTIALCCAAVAHLRSLSPHWS